MALRKIQKLYIDTSFKKAHLNFANLTFIVSLYLQYHQLTNSVATLNIVVTTTIAIAL